MRPVLRRGLSIAETYQWLRHVQNRDMSKTEKWTEQRRALEPELWTLTGMRHVQSLHNVQNRDMHKT
jgi:hypothetical protein